VRYELTLTAPDLDETISLSGDLDADEQMLLEDYLRSADELLETRFCKGEACSSLTMDWRQGSFPTFRTQLPHWDDVIVFLHRFRPIGLNDESTSFYRIRNLLAKKLPHPYLRQMLGQVRDIYSGKAAQGRMKILSNEVVVNSEETLNTWLNAYEYHRDREKQTSLHNLLGLLPMEAAQVLFVGLLSDKALAIAQLATVVRVVLGRQKSLTGQAGHSPT